MAVDLIGLAAFLHRQSCARRAAATNSSDPKFAKAALQDAELFQHASDIIKQKADERRKQRALVVDLDRPAASLTDGGFLAEKAVPREELVTETLRLPLEP